MLLLVITAVVGTLYLIGNAPTDAACEPAEGDVAPPEAPIEETSANGSEEDVGQFEEARDHNSLMTSSGVAAVLATGGAIGYPLLGVLSVPIVVYTSMPIFRDAYSSVVQERKLRAPVLDSVAIVGTIAAGKFLAGALGAFVYHLGQKLVGKTKDRSRKSLTKSLTDVFGEYPRSVWLLRDDQEIEVSYESVRAGDVIVVTTGEAVPVDGRIVEGLASIDQRMLTGEAQPAEKEVGDVVLATTVVLSGRICVEVDRAGMDTVAGHIADILSRTADFKMAIQTKSEAAADKAVLPTLGLSALALASLGPGSAVAMTYCNFSDVFRVVAPLSTLRFLKLASEGGMLIKDGRALELLHGVDTVVFDKTGTLTREQPHVSHVYAWNGVADDALVAYAAAAEIKQTHPIARALRQEAGRRGLRIPTADEAAYQIGYGVTVRLDDHRIRVGSARFMAMDGVVLPDEIRARQAEGDAQASSFVYVAIDGQLGGAIELHPTIRPEAKTIVRQLQERDLEMVILSGDHDRPTRMLARELGISRYIANTIPERKAEVIAHLQEEGRSVCFVGDGINDALALKQADVSVSLRGASTVAIDTAQVVLMDGNLTQLDALFGLGQTFNSNIKTSAATTLVPSLACVGGIFFLNFGVTSVIVAYNLSLAAGAANALLPRALRGTRSRPLGSTPETVTAETDAAPQSQSV